MILGLDYYEPDETSRLDEMDVVEYWDVVRRDMPGLTFEEYAATWALFQAEKAEKEWVARLH